MSPFKPDPNETEDQVTYTKVDISVPGTPLFKLDEDEVACCFYYPMLEWLYKYHEGYAENADVHFRLMGALPDCMGNICSEIITNRMYTLAVHCLMKGVRLFMDDIMQRPRMDFSRDVEQVLKRAGSLAEQLRQPLLPLTAEVRETVKEIKRRTLAMEPVVGAAAYYVGYTYMAGLNGRYWDFPRSDMVSKALTLWFQDSLNRQKTAMALTEQ